MANETFTHNINSPFFNVLSDAESIQVREVVPSTQPTIMASLEEAIKSFDKNDPQIETRSFLVTIKKPTASTPVASTTKSKDNDELSSVLNKAELLLKNEDYLLARNLFSFILKKELKNATALRGLGQCLLNLGDTSAAKKCFNALIEIHKSQDGYVLLGISLIKENNDTAAHDSFTKITEAAALPADLRFQFHKEFGNCLTRLEKFNEASEAYHHALSLNPRSHIILINLGTLEIQRKRFEKATRYFQQAIDFCPTAAKAFCGIGIVAQMSGENDIAEMYFQKTLEVDCLNSVALHQLYTLADSESDLRGLRKLIVQALIKDPAHLENRFLLAATLFKQNDWSGCETELNVILKKSPDHTKARQLRNELSLHKHRQGGNI
jgi:tetratricopeptide (TPR) repeat protein